MSEVTLPQPFKDSGATPSRAMPPLSSISGPCTPTARGVTAMHLAAQNGSVGCLKLLLDRGADHTIVDGAHGGTPLGWAEYSYATEAAEILGART